MGVIFESLWVDLFFLVTTVAVVVASYFYNAYKYWERKVVPTIPPRFPLGNTDVILPQGLTVGIICKRFYDEFKSRGKRFGGVYLITEPNLVLVDPSLIRDVLIRDFSHFVNRGVYHSKEGDPIGVHLFSVDGLDWRNLRVKLTPTFTSGKMKMMFEQMFQCSDYMIEAIGKSLGEDIDIIEVSGRFTTDVIGSCAFGIDCNSFKHPDAEFRRMGKRINQRSFWRLLKSILVVNFPKLAKELRVMYNNRDVSEFFSRIVAETVTMREEKQTRRNDFLQILIDMKNTNELTMHEVAAQVFLFFVAGFETSSTTITFALYEMSKHLDVQEKVRREVNDVLDKHNGQMTYESLHEMKYLERVMDETLRMYPPLLVLNRNCSKKYTIPDTDIVIEPGTPVLISTMGLHRDPEYFPEPDRFDPGRFSDANKRLRPPLVYLPFGDGPRNCIGLRFGAMQTKMGIATILKHFRLSVSPATKPVEINPCTFLLKSVHGIYLRAEKV